ncbi:MAG: tRNA guanosine(34) transglycosylase Tgt [Acidimicrobiales bacterium]
MDIPGFEVQTSDGEARAGRLWTTRYEVETPVFMPVGTRGSVRTVTSADLEDLGAGVILGNTYHLMLRPGEALIERFGGIHGFADWNRLVLTDSGGYQIFSLEPKVDDDGATFKSTYDGSSHHLSPERAVDIQLALGSDIQMVLDVCPPLPAPDSVLRSAVDRTTAWATRARPCFLERRDGLDGQRAQFGIVQGGLDLDLRRRSAGELLEIGFDGYAIGGLSVGESRDEMIEPLRATTAVLPPDRPRYFMGLGDPVGLVDAVAVGVDMFDCVWPTRMARHGTALTKSGRLNVSAGRYSDDDAPLDPDFPESPANRWSRGYLRHLLSVGEPAAARILTLHNLAWVFDLMSDIRSAIEVGRFEVLRREIHETWG